MSWIDILYILEKYNGKLRKASNDEIQRLKRLSPYSYETHLKIAKERYASGKRMFDFDMPKVEVAYEVGGSKENKTEPQL